MMKQRFTLYVSMALMFLVWLVPRDMAAQKCVGGLDSIQQVCIDISCGPWVTITWEAHAGNCYDIVVGTTVMASNQTGKTKHSVTFSKTAVGIADSTRFIINEKCGTDLGGCSGGTVPIDAFLGVLPPLDSAGTWKFENTLTTGLTGNGNPGVNAIDSAVAFTPESPTDVPKLTEEADFEGDDGYTVRPTCTMGAMAMDGKWHFGATFDAGVIDSLKYAVYTNSTKTIPVTGTDSVGTKILAGTDIEAEFWKSNLIAGTYYATIVAYSGSCIDSVWVTKKVHPGADEPILACSDHINLSVDGQCMAEFNIPMILAGTANICGLQLMDSLVLRHAKNGHVIATTNQGDGDADTIRLENAYDYIGKTLVLEVHSTNDTVSNWCWGTVLIEDKLPPILNCDTLQVIPCYKFDGNTLDHIKVKDCDPDPVINMVSEELITNCDVLPDSIIKRIVRRFTATDYYGNTSKICTDTLDIERLDANPNNNMMDGNTLDIVGLVRPRHRITQNSAENPRDTVPFICDSRYPYADYDHDHIPDPVDYLIDSHGDTLYGAGVPEIDTVINGEPWKFKLHPSNYVHVHENVTKLLETCKTVVYYSDLILPTNNCIKKVIRTWTIREWACDEETTLEFIQNIEVIDTLGPDFDVPADMKVSTNLKTCERYMKIPPPIDVHDYCKNSEVGKVIVNVKNGVYVGTLSTDAGNFDLTNGGYLNLPYGKDTIYYHVFDDCHNETIKYFIIEVVDETAPVVICHDEIIVGIADDGETGNGEVWVPAESFDAGTYDDCGLKDLCVVRMDDLDAFDDLQDQGIGNYIDEDEHKDWYVPLSALITACGREFEKSGTNDDGEDYIVRADLCTPKVMFCCEDVDDTTPNPMVVMRATDKAGNTNECMIEVEAQDKRTPIVHCPPDITIDCRFDFKSDSTYSIFGDVVAEGEQKNIAIDPDYIIDSEDGKPLVDGVWFGNCNATVTVTAEENINQCREGYVIRTFIVTANNGNTAKCKQKITFSRKNVLKPEDIEFPDDFTTESCADPDQFPPEMTGTPSVDEQDCTLVGWAYEDLTVLFNDDTGDACFKIIRNWTVIDWCKSPSFVLATGTQIIKVNDVVDPVIDGNDNGICAPKTVDVLDNECYGGFAELTQTASDNCTDSVNLRWTIQYDADNDGDIDDTFTRVGYTADISDDYPIGLHRFIWEVRDQCGNIDVCEQLVTIRNIKEPTPICITNITGSLMPVDDGSSQNGQPLDSIPDDGIPDGGMLTVWASEYDIGSSTHPCKLKLVYSFEPDSLVPSRDFTCADLGINNLSVHVLAIDKHTGEIVSSDFCSVVLDLDDNNNTCDTTIFNPASVIISGNIHTALGDNVPTAEISLLGANAGASTLATSSDEGGMYAFNGMPIGGTYSVSPNLDRDVLNGVSTLDLVLIQKHILGLQRLAAPYSIIAGDINDDRSLSAIDLVELRKVILGITDKFSRNTSWRFVDVEYVFDDVERPLQEAFNEKYDIFDLNRNMIVDFVGVKVGDVNSSVNVTGLLTSPRSIARLNVVDMDLTAGQKVRIPVTFQEIEEILGYQFTMEYDQAAITFTGFESGVVELGAENFGTFGMDVGVVTTSWGSVNAVDVSKDHAFVLEFEVHRAARLSDVLSVNSEITVAETYSANEEVLDLTLEFAGVQDITSSGYELLQNTPNPFSETTLIGFTLPKTADATISIFDVTGKLVKEYSGSFAKGLNTIEVEKGQLNAVGVLYYTLDTDEFTSTRRMVLIK